MITTRVRCQQSIVSNGMEKTRKWRVRYGFSSIGFAVKEARRNRVTHGPGSLRSTKRAVSKKSPGRKTTDLFLYVRLLRGPSMLNVMSV